MAYTRNWDSTTPTGSSQISAGDDAIRAFKVDVEERLESVFVDIDADPLEVKPEVIEEIGSVTGKKLVLPPHILQPRQDEHDIEYQNEYVKLDGVETMQGWLALPLGITITGFECTCDPISGTTVTVEFYKVAFDTGVKSTIVTITRGVAGIGACTASGTLAEVVDEDNWYGVRVVGNAPRIYGFRLTYDTPDARNTI